MTPSPALTENDIVAAVCGMLESSGYEIVQRRHTSERGIDVIAHPSDTSRPLLHIEAKGATSARKGSRRFGIPYGSGEARINIAEALYTAAVGTMRDSPTRWAIALSDDGIHRKLVEPLQPALDELGIGLFWVEGAESVRFVGPWELSSTTSPRTDELDSDFVGVFDRTVYPQGYLDRERGG